MRRVSRSSAPFRPSPAPAARCCADRYAINSFAVEWRWLTELLPIEDEWRELAGRALEPNIFYEPGFALRRGRRVRPRRRRGAGVVGTAAAQAARLLSRRGSRERRYGHHAAGAGRLDPSLRAARHAAGRTRRGRAGDCRLACASCRQSGSCPGLVLLPLSPSTVPFAATLARNSAPDRKCPWPISPAITRACSDAGRRSRSTMSSATLSAHRLRELRRTAAGSPITARCCLRAATEPKRSSARAIEDFFALEARGWKGEAGTAAAPIGRLQRFIKTRDGGARRRRQGGDLPLLLDGRPIAAAITLRSGDAAWYWKTAYDERLARYAPGVLLTAALTEELAEDPRSAAPIPAPRRGNPMIDLIWGERLALCDRLIAVRPQRALRARAAGSSGRAAQPSTPARRSVRRLAPPSVDSLGVCRFSLAIRQNAENEQNRCPIRSKSAWAAMGRRPPRSRARSS